MALDLETREAIAKELERIAMLVRNDQAEPVEMSVTAEYEEVRYRDGSTLSRLKGLSVRAMVATFVPQLGDWRQTR